MSAPERHEIAAVSRLRPPPTSVTDVATRLQWRRQRAARVLRAWRRRQAPDQQPEEPEPPQHVGTGTGRAMPMSGVIQAAHREYAGQIPRSVPGGRT